MANPRFTFGSGLISVPHPTGWQHRVVRDAEDISAQLWLARRGPDAPGPQIVIRTMCASNVFEDHVQQLILSLRRLEGVRRISTDYRVGTDELRINYHMQVKGRAARHLRGLVLLRRSATYCARLDFIAAPADFLKHHRVAQQISAGLIVAETD